MVPRILSSAAFVLQLLALPAAGQVGTLLGIPSLNSFSLQSTSSPQIFSLPPSGPPITVSVALCTDAQPLPRFFVSATSGPNQIGPNDPNSAEIHFNNGVGWWTGEVQSGATIAGFVGNGVSTSLSAQWQFEIGVQEGNTPAHEFSSIRPVLGDTASTQAIVFSPSFQGASSRPPSAWPNYTLPAIRPSFNPPQYIPPSSILIFPTPGQISSLSFFASACALRSIPSTLATQTAFNVTTSTIVRDPLYGWQTEFLVEAGLKPSTNYSVWMTLGPKVSGPLYLWTKSATFSDTCTFVHGLSYCPLVSYPTPIPASLLPSLSADPNKFANLTHSPVIDEDSLPEAISSSILSSLGNFSRVLSTFPCGRDVYSPLHECNDCFDAYRTWACFVSLPRCGEPIQNITAPTTVLSAQEGDNGRQSTFSLKQRPAASAPRAVGFPASPSAYDELLPCIETCNAVRRTCPPLMGWKCPVPTVNAEQSYVLGIWDSWDGMSEGQGVIGIPGAMGNGTVPVSDSYGRVWCNGA